LALVFAGLFLTCGGGDTTEPEEPQGPSGPAQEASLATGGDVTFVSTGTDAWDEVHTFRYDAALDTGSGADYTLTFRNGAPAIPIEAQLLIVAGGGAGGVIYYGTEAPAGYAPLSTFYALSEANYAVTVGKGGAVAGAAARGGNGVNSVFASALSAVGGGGGGGGASGTITGNSGGSGGGGWGTTGGARTANQGYKGGNAGSARACGGGGAGGAASDISATIAGNGGAGIALSISGQETEYAGGGASGAYYGENNFGSETPGYMGTATHGGGSTGNPGTDGTGGGGSGASGLAHPAQKGGDGIVIVRFPWTAPTEGEQQER
jgi:hypothetical protein